MAKPKLLVLDKKVRKKLEELERNEKNKKQWLRYKAILLCTEMPRKEVIKMFRIHYDTLKLWIKNFNLYGIEGLKIKPKPGRTPLLDKEKKEQIVKIIKENREGWTTEEIRELIEKVGGITYTKRHIYRLSHKWGLSLQVPRPSHVARKEKEVKAFKKTLRK